MKVAGAPGLFLLGLALTGCLADINGGGGPAGGKALGSGPADGGPGGAAIAPGAGVPLAARMQRLTAFQYRTIIAGTFGTGITVPELELDSRIAGFDELGATRVATSARGVELYEAAAVSIAAQVMGDAEHLAATLGCTPASAGAADEACASTFLDRVGRRLLRRPLDVAERARYLSIAAEGATATQSFGAGLELMLGGLLQSPLFLYRAEWGEGTLGAVVRVSGYDMAARLSFGLLDTGPDDELLDAAGRGELDGESGVRQHAARLLSSEGGQQNLENFFSSMLRLPSGASVEALAMKQETLLVLQELKAQRAPFTDIYAAPFTFINDALAELYGLPDRPGATLTKVVLPAAGVRRGLLGHAGVLSESGLHASPILRGKYVREALLCQVIPAPPPNVVAMLPTADGSAPQTMRQRLTQHRADPACATCHNLMDPIGLALENFDGTGRYRADDGGLLIDASGELDGTPFADAIGLGAALAAHPDASRCLVATLHRRLTGQYEDSGQSPTLHRLSEAYRLKRQTIDELAAEIIGAETFLFATLPTD